MCIKVEQQLLRKSSPKRDQANSYANEPEKGMGEAFVHTRKSDIKCFKCLGRGHIILRGIDRYSNQEETSIG